MSIGKRFISLTVGIISISGGIILSDLPSHRVFAQISCSEQLQSCLDDGGDSGVCYKEFEECQKKIEGGITHGGETHKPPPEVKKTELQECIDKCTPGNKISCECKCNGGIVLNTDIPFVGRCILKDGTASGGGTAISGISRALTSIFMTLILTGGFAMIIWGGVQISMGDIKGGRSKIFNVIVAFAVLGSLGILLRLINPNFFK